MLDGGKKIKYFRVNERIQAETLRVISPQGTQLGILSRNEALQIAKSQGLDLIEVAPQIQPPVAKILDFQKFRYGESKKERVAKRHAREVELKEIWLSPRIASHDLEVRLKRAEEFLKRGDKVKLTVKFKGREMAYPETGHNVLNQAFAYFGKSIDIEREVKFEGRNLTTIIGATKPKQKEENHEEDKTKN